MKKILINKQIGSDYFEDGITADFVRRELDQAMPGEEIQLIIDSPGGYVWDCIAIYNVIRDFCRSHSNRVNTYIQGIAMSSASVIALAAKNVSRENKVIVEDNSIFMVHNAWTATAGNESDLRRAADGLSKIDGVIAAAYVAATGKKESVIRGQMLAETYFYGAEIVEDGFADSVVENSGGAELDGAAALASAKHAWHETQKIMEQAKNIAAQKIAAMAKPYENQTPAVQSSGGEKQTGGCMTAEEFKNAHPDEAKKLFAEGVNAERERVEAHLKMGEIAASLDTAAKFIREGKAIAETDVQTAYFEARIKNSSRAEREQDNVPPITTPAEDKDAGMKEALAAFDARIGGAR